MRRSVAVAATAAVSLLGAPASAVTSPETAATADSATVLRLLHSDATDARANRSAAPNTAEPLAHTVYAPFYDVCDDSVVDVHSAFVADSYGSKNFVFGYETCPRIGKTPRQITMTWRVDLNWDYNPDYIVGLVTSTNGQYRARVLDVSSPNEADWYISYDGPASTGAEPKYGNDWALGAIPWDALDYASEFGFAVTAFDDTSSATDSIPQDDEGSLAFPYSCDATQFRAARVTTSGPAETATVAESYRQAGYTVSGVGLETMLVQPAPEPGNLPRFRGVVDVGRPVLMETYAATSNDPHPNSWAFNQIRAPQAWARTPSATANVAVLDSGIDGRRADLLGRTGAGYDAWTGKAIAAGQNSQRGPHGTSVASVIAAARGNGVETAGINPGATVLPYRVSDPSGCTFLEYAIAALDRITATKSARIVNMSFGFAGSDLAFAAAVRRAASAGVVMVAATGNAGTGVVAYPAAYPEVIAVGATGSDGRVSSYSSYGPQVEIVAPGGTGAASPSAATEIMTLDDFDLVTPMSGTSFASP